MNPDRERTLVLLKPDAVRRGLIGELIRRFENRGLDILALKLMQFDEELVHRHYGEHEDRPFFPRLKQFILSGPTVAMVVEAPAAIRLVRTMIGPTNFVEAQPGTIRGDYVNHITINVVHGSDSPESAAREIPLFFEPEEIFAVAE